MITVGAGLQLRAVHGTGARAAGPRAAGFRRCPEATSFVLAPGRSPWRCRRASRNPLVVEAAAPGSQVVEATPHLQLATAKLPADVDVAAFAAQLYQWASTLGQNGRNLPFALPLRVDPLPDGFQISLLRVADRGRIVSVADLVARVEPVSGAGNVLMVRLFEAEGSGLLVGAGVAAGSDSQARLKTLLAGLPDVNTIMQTMPGAIKQAAMMAR